MKNDLKKLSTNALAVDSNGEWSFHPKPQSKPCGIVFAPETRTNEQKLTSKEIQTAIAHKRRHKAKGNGFGYFEITENKPCCTLPKTLIKSSSAPRIIDQNKQHWLPSLVELCRIGSFPDDYKFIDYKTAWIRVGNSVPPNLMKAIALNLKQSPFLKNIKQPTVIGTFTGGGGSSLGFHLAGFKELLAVEYDDNAVETFKMNFPNVKVFHGDIATLSVEKALAIADLKVRELDCLQGSPPCQGFSTAGSRKLNDPRNSLFKEYARLLKGLQPKCFVMENVTGMIKGHMKSSYLTIINTLRECGYKAKGQVMNAKYYNVPQSRERVIIVGVRKDIIADCSIKY